MEQTYGVDDDGGERIHIIGRKQRIKRDDVNLLQREKGSDRKPFWIVAPSQQKVSSLAISSLASAEPSAPLPRIR